MTALLVSAVPFGTTALAQHRGVHRGMPAAGMQRHVVRPNVHRPAMPQTRWGNRYQGRWYGGYRAPGGWSAYRRPVRGYVVPRYWVQPSFYIADFAGYGLGAPQQGYGWYRYYDDAVLVDQRGHVHDSVAGVEWDRDGRAYVDHDEAYREEYYADRDGDVVRDDEYRDRRRDNGVGGALVGGAVGAVAGGVIAGRGNRLGGALIGGGVGAVAGAVIDREEDRGRRGPPPPRGPRYGADYAEAPPPPLRGPDVRYGARGEIVQPLPGEAYADEYYEDEVGYADRATTTYHHGGAAHPQVVTTTGGYVAGGYYYPPVTTTTITYGQPVTTTTITEEYVTYSAPVKTKRVYRAAKRKWKPKPRCVC